MSNLLAWRVVADNTHQRHMSAERCDIHRDVRCSAKSCPARVWPQHRYWCFRRQAAGVAADIAVQHHVAENQHPRIGETADNLRQFGIADRRLRGSHQ